MAGFRLYHMSPPPLNWDADSLDPRHFWVLQTCLRTIVLSDGTTSAQALEGFEIFNQEEAYGFLLEVVCGLHSPMVGETEILGQFKNFLLKHQEFFPVEVRKLLDKLLSETKKIRKDHLQNLGCTSYGSLLRKSLSSQGLYKQPLTILGAGALVDDILPWLVKNQSQVTVYTRTPQNHQGLLGRYPGLQLHSLDDIPINQSGVLVIAAAADPQILQQWADQNSFSTVFDLRGESRETPVQADAVIPLDTLFLELESNRHRVMQVKEKVVGLIQGLAQKWEPLERHRPMGWEDLWTFS